MDITRKKAIERCEHWWLADNIVSHPGQIALIKMDFPQVFILIRDYGEAMFAGFYDFKDRIAEINFFNPADRGGVNIEEILTDAWNFLSLEEEEEERRYGEYEEEDYL